MVLMNQILFVIIIILVAVGYFCMGFVFGNRRELYWRIKWIELEHDTARKLGSEPRNIKCVEPDMSEMRRLLKISWAFIRAHFYLLLFGMWRGECLYTAKSCGKYFRIAAGKGLLSDNSFVETKQFFVE